MNHQKPSHKYTHRDLFQQAALKRITVKLMLVGFATCSVFQGLSLNSAALPMSTFKAVSIHGLIDGVSRLLSVILLNHKKIGRKGVLSVGLIGSGICCLLSAYFYELNSQPQTQTYYLHIAISFLSRGTIGATYGSTFTYAAELYPTPIRSTGMSLVTLFGGVGAILSPSFLILNQFGKFYPELIFSSLSFVGGLVVLLLPETQGLPIQ